MNTALKKPGILVSYEKQYCHESYSSMLEHMKNCKINTFLCLPPPPSPLPSFLHLCFVFLPSLSFLSSLPAFLFFSLQTNEDKSGPSEKAVLIL